MGEDEGVSVRTEKGRRDGKVMGSLDGVEVVNIKGMRVVDVAGA